MAKLEGKKSLRVSNSGGSETFLKTVEGKIFLAGWGLLISVCILVVLFRKVLPNLPQDAALMCAADNFAGRAATLSLGLRLGVPRWVVIPLSICFSLTSLFLFYPLIVYFYERVVEIKIIGPALDTAKKMAEKQQPKIERYGAFGIAVFVWIPFFMTGSIVGAVLGYIIGMRTKTVMVTVITSVVLSAISWGIAFDYMLEFAESVGKFLPIIMVGGILGIAVFFRLQKLYQTARQRLKNRKE